MKILVLNGPNLGRLDLRDSKIYGDLDFAGLKEKIIAVLTDSATDGIENIMYVEIKCKSKNLFLIYFDSDSWALGHGDSVLVVKSLAQLNRKNGYYPLS